MLAMVGSHAILQEHGFAISVDLAQSRFIPPHVQKDGTSSIPLFQNFLLTAIFAQSITFRTILSAVEVPCWLPVPSPQIQPTRSIRMVWDLRPVH
jgi:hypothetical protein